MIIDQHRAHERILYDKFTQTLSSGKIATQNLVFPRKLDLNVQDSALLCELLGELVSLGFDIYEFGKNSFIVRGIPAGMQTNEIEKTIENFLGVYQNLEKLPDSLPCTRLITALVDTGAIPYGKMLSSDEMNHLIDMLFRSSNPNYSPSGKLIFTIINSDEIEKRFK